MSLAELAGSDRRIVDTDTLRQIVVEADARRHSRLPSEEAMERLDPAGVHVLTRLQMMFLPFARCILLMKIAGEREPVEVWLDLDDETYSALPRARTYQVEL